MVEDFRDLLAELRRAEARFEDLADIESLAGE
jgi:uncharacterized protein YdcH (DUF465 family)